MRPRNGMWTALGEEGVHSLTWLTRRERHCVRIHGVHCERIDLIPEDEAQPLLCESERELGFCRKFTRYRKRRLQDLSCWGDGVENPPRVRLACLNTTVG